MKRLLTRKRKAQAVTEYSLTTFAVMGLLAWCNLAGRIVSASR